MAINISIPKSVNETLAEETGWHIGDGSMNFYNQGDNGKLKGIYQLRGHIEDDKPHYIERIKPIFKSLYGIDVSLREMPSTRVFGFQIWNNELVKFKQNLGLPLGKKFDISIPKQFLKNDALKAAVIRGIFDTDGCVYLEKKNHKLYPRLQICTISENLALQLLDILNNLEIRTTMSKDSFCEKGNKKQAYITYIRGIDMFEKFIKVIKPMNSKHLQKYKLLHKNL
jgi:DNA-binding transcriptional regulator WhiA